jgi:hypothetical protein
VSRLSAKALCHTVCLISNSYDVLICRDVDAISESGNLHTVGAELAVSSLLSSVARRAISPNFVITRGV